VLSKNVVTDSIQNIAGNWNQAASEGYLQSWLQRYHERG